VVGFDLDDPACRRSGAPVRAEPRVPHLRADEPFPFADGEFALATAIEVLEHVPDPEGTLAEMARVARGGHVLVSVPREPLWRALNVARGAYLRDLGNTPGHSTTGPRSIAALLAGTARVVEARRRARGPCSSPGVTRRRHPRRPAARPAATRGTPRRASPSARRDGWSRFAYFSLASHG
jgi:SAM-dependent methyltransferase